MRLIFSMLAICTGITLGAQDKADSLAFADADWTVTDLGNGAEARTASIHMFESTQSISIISYPARGFKTQLIEGEGVSDEKISIRKGHANHSDITSSLAGAADASFAINGSYFNMKELTPTTYTRIGKTVWGKPAEKLTGRTNGVVMMKGHDIDIATCTDPEAYKHMTKGWKYALASGHVLIEDEAVVSYPDDHAPGFYDKRHPRSIIGICKNGRGKTEKVYFIVIDGRFPGQADGATIPECAAIARFLGCDEALNLDGGGSSTLWSEKAGVLNHPYDNRVFDHKGERRVPNIIIAK